MKLICCILRRNVTSWESKFFFQIFVQPVFIAAIFKPLYQMDNSLSFIIKAAISAMKKGLLRNVASLKEDNWIIIIFLYFKKVKLNFYSARSLKQQSTNRQVSPLRHIILISSQPFLVISP
jgi:hypothetical protein